MLQHDVLWRRPRSFAPAAYLAHQRLNSHRRKYLLRVLSRTPESPFISRETVMVETPARSATLTIVAPAPSRTGGIVGREAVN